MLEATLLKRLEALLRKGKQRSFDHLFPLKKNNFLVGYFGRYNLPSRAEIYRVLIYSL